MREGPSVSRRAFIKLAATATAATAIPGCEPAARKLIPYVVPDENVVPGVPSFFATTCNECPAGCGVVARIREGRVIKLEGNPADPIGQGSLCARGQAALQGLYNPDRLARPQVRGSDRALRTVSWDDAEKMLGDKHAAEAKAGKGRGAVFPRPRGRARIASRFAAARRGQPSKRSRSRSSAHAIRRARYFTRQSTRSRCGSRPRHSSAGAICRPIESIRP